MRKPIAALFMVISVACSDPEGPSEAVCEPEPEYAYAPGSMWGPCLPDATCDSGAECYELDNVLGKIGNLCTTKMCTDHPDCVEGLDHIDGMLPPCRIPCDHAVDCTPGMICRDGGDSDVCVWPVE